MGRRKRWKRSSNPDCWQRNRSSQLEAKLGQSLVAQGADGAGHPSISGPIQLKHALPKHGRDGRQLLYPEAGGGGQSVELSFDSIDHELLLKAVRHHTDCPWVLLYVERWLKAPVQMEGGTVVPRDKGTPQGGVVSPILANLFLHYAFDRWMSGQYPAIPFERYADDIICHCQSLTEAQTLWDALVVRFDICGLVLHPVKTKIAHHPSVFGNRVLTAGICM